MPPNYGLTSARVLSVAQGPRWLRRLRKADKRTDAGRLTVTKVAPWSV